MYNCRAGFIIYNVKCIIAVRISVEKFYIIHCTLYIINYPLYIIHCTL